MAGRSRIRHFLFRILPFDAYLWVLSRMFYTSYRFGLLKSKPEYAYFYFLKKLVKPGAVILDIGANLGYFTRLFSDWVGTSGQVHAVEPVAEMRTQLVRNVSRGGNVTVYPFALGEVNKTIILANDSRQKLGYIASGQHYVLDQEAASEQKADTFPAEMRIGSELFRHMHQIDGIKCDVEGYEVVILTEMKSLIEKHLPFLLVEAEGAKRVAVFALMTDMGYHCFELNGEALQRLDKPSMSKADLLYIHPSSDVMHRINQ